MLIYIDVCHSLYEFLYIFCIVEYAVRICSQ